MSVSNSSARTFDGLISRSCIGGATHDVGVSTVKRFEQNGVIDMVRRIHVKAVTRGSKKYARVMKQHRAILLARENSK